MIEEYGICVFDYSQAVQSLKFQRGGSSEFLLATSILYLKVMVPIFISLTQWPDTMVPLTYLNQKILLPLGMQVYEPIKTVTPDVLGVLLFAHQLWTCPVIKLNDGLN